MALPYQVLALVVVVAVGVAVASAAERQLQRQDPSEIVIDELAGVWVALLGSHLWVAWIVGFVLFRLFDIFKPPPIRQAERLSGGLGVLADDLVVGAFAAGVLLLTWQAACSHISRSSRGRAYTPPASRSPHSGRVSWPSHPVGVVAVEAARRNAPGRPPRPSR